MDTALIVGLAHQSALKRKMEVVAHNIANMNTTAFNKEKVVFRKHLIDVPGSLGGKVATVMDHGTLRSLTEGTMIPTENPLDIFLAGRIYLSVEGKDGETYFTRNGRMSLDNENNLTTLNGEKILDADGSPITFEDDEFDIVIAQDGTISTNIGEKGQIGVKTIGNEQAMKRVGGSLYSTNSAAEDPEPGTFEIKQRSIERSNVNAIEEMAQMIDIHRAYEKSTKLKQDYGDLRKDALDRLAKVQ